jgi:nicotinamidase-related amidase
LASENRSDRAILILDMINDLVHSEGRHYEATTADIIPFIQGELQYFRERMRPVIFCSTTGSLDNNQKESDPFDFQIIQALSPRTGEICIKKRRPNAFFDTELINILKGLKVRNVTVVGVFSHTSVLLTAASALDYGFSVVVPETCICARNPQDHAAALRLIGRLLDE